MSLFNVYTLQDFTVVLEVDGKKVIFELIDESPKMAVSQAKREISKWVEEYNYIEPTIKLLSVARTKNNLNNPL